jgi:hypothetical protein
MFQEVAVQADYMRADDSHFRFRVRDCLHLECSRRKMESMMWGDCICSDRIAELDRSSLVFVDVVLGLVLPGWPPLADNTGAPGGSPFPSSAILPVCFGTKPKMVRREDRMNQEFENIIIPELLNVVSGFHRPEN